MLKRPFIEGQEAAEIFPLRTKFNSAMEEQIRASKDTRHRIMSIDVPLDEFDRQGNLTNIGKNSFWREVDRAMRKFDIGDIKLIPRGMFLLSEILAVPIDQMKQHSTRTSQPSRAKVTAPSAIRKSPPARKRLWSSPPKSKRSPKRSRSRSKSRNRHRHSHHHHNKPSHRHSSHHHRY